MSIGVSVSYEPDGSPCVSVKDRRLNLLVSDTAGSSEGREDTAKRWAYPILIRVVSCARFIYYINRRSVWILVSRSFDGKYISL